MHSRFPVVPGGRRRFRAAALLFLLMASGVMTPGVQALTLKPDAPAQYTVRKGDTLWGIAARFLEQPWRWRELMATNPAIASPDRLFAGDVIVLDGNASRPRISLDRGRGETVTLSPGVRRAPARDAVPGLPLEHVRVFLSAYQVVDPGVLDGAPTVVAGDSQRLLSGPGDRLYANGGLPAEGSVLGIYRPGARYHDASSGEFLGLELHRLGRARVRRNLESVGELAVLDAVQEIRGGDFLLALDEGGIATQFAPRAPSAPVVATLIDAPGGVRYVGRLDVITLDRGRRDGLEVGHVLQAMRQGERVRDDHRESVVTLPDIEAGAVMVFRVFERVSYALVMRASQPLSVGDRLVVPRDLRTTLAGEVAP
ncbi:LysM peptidoglycan-binding domain-containing protein [Salinicola halophilus]|uniref:LysM peptidoglycan-binding domain-containing protein n=1 Tax=Salinicola halophilus TaxID=184065 RepID=UPI0013A68106|nr:LysM domain-containing protein [Salinicola halophilus]